MKLKEIRLKNGYTQQFLADNINVSIWTYRDWERTPCSLHKAQAGSVQKLAKLIGMNTDELLEKVKDDKD